MSSSWSESIFRQRAQRITPIAPPITPPYQTSPEPEKTLPRRSSETSLQFWIRKSIRDPTIPPISPAKMIS